MSQPKIIFLTGFMGSGKTRIGSLLAKKLNLPFIDTDTLILNQTGLSINEIFKTKGEPYFRNLESKILRGISQKSVVSLGGGAILSAHNRAHLNKNIWIYLKARPATLWQRLQGDQTRPLLKGKNKRQKLEQLLTQREPLYKLAPYHIQTDGLVPSKIVQHILTTLRKTS